MTEYLRHEYTWSSHCISGNRLGWGITASSVPEEKEHLRELEKLAQAAVIDKTGKIAVEELSCSPGCGFVKMISLPCKSGEDNRQNKKVSIFEPQGDRASDPACYLAPGSGDLWEEQTGLLAPVRLESLCGEADSILEEMGIIHRLPEFMRAVFWCLFGNTEGLNIAAPSWREEEFGTRSARLMYVIHQFLPECVRKKAGYVSFTREALPSVPFYFSKKPCGAHTFLIGDEQGEEALARGMSSKKAPTRGMQDREAEQEPLDAYFFTEFAQAFLEKNQIFTEFRKQAQAFLEGAEDSGNTLKKLEWIFYDIAGKEGGEPLDFAYMTEHFPELLYWTAKDGRMKKVSEDIAGEIHRHDFTANERKSYVQSLLSGMTGKSRALVLRELDWMLSSLYAKDKAQFARLLADIREKNRDVYTTLLCAYYPEETDCYGRELFARNAGTMEKLRDYVLDLKESSLSSEFKDHILRTGIRLLNEKIFDKKRYEAFDQIALHLKREGQWTEILKDFVGQLEEHAHALDHHQLDTACYVEKLLYTYRPQATALRLREEKRHRSRRRKTDRSSDAGEEESHMGKRYKGNLPDAETEKARSRKEVPAPQGTEDHAARAVRAELVEEEEKEGPLLPFLLTGFPQGFLTGCIMYLSHHSLMIGHWKIALGMAGMWILLMLNYECVLLQNREPRPLWKILGLCLLEGWLIEVAAWFFRSQKIRLYYFIALGILTVLIQVINLIRIKRQRDRE